MVHQLNIHDVTYAKDIEQANYPQVRQFFVWKGLFVALEFDAIHFN